MATRWSAEDAARAGRALAVKLARKSSADDILQAWVDKHPRKPGETHSDLERLVMATDMPATPPASRQPMHNGPQGAGGSAGAHTRAWKIDESGSGETIVTRKPSKYHAQPTGGYASTKEARRGAELKLLAAAGAITDLREQVPFELIPVQRTPDGKIAEHATKYVADFTYMEKGAFVCEDCKGVRTPEYIIKRKLMLQRGIRIRET